MRYCALMGDIEWYEDSLKKDLQKAKKEPAND